MPKSTETKPEEVAVPSLEAPRPLGDWFGEMCLPREHKAP